MGFIELFREIPSWIKVIAAVYFCGLLTVAYVIAHFVMKFW